LSTLILALEIPNTAVLFRKRQNETVIVLAFDELRTIVADDGVPNTRSHSHHSACRCAACADDGERGVA
jgi:hypothetical protein